MIDTYFDRVDAAQGYRDRETLSSFYYTYNDPRYYNGQLYCTMIDRNVAEAKDRLASMLHWECEVHRREMRLDIKPGSLGSLFTTSGKRKN